MSLPGPHYVLFSESSETDDPGRWRFVLRTSDGSERLVADDIEPQIRGERLELLTVVRGLEALDQPSRVTLITPSAYVREGIRHGLSEWRRNGWRWESFGRMIPVRHSDLWQRIDRALDFHEVECRPRRFDPPHSLPGAPAGAGKRPERHVRRGSPDPAGACHGQETVPQQGDRATTGGSTRKPCGAKCRLGQIVDRCRHWLAKAFLGGTRPCRVHGQP